MKLKVQSTSAAEQKEKMYCFPSHWWRAVWRELLQENLQGMQSISVMCRCLQGCVRKSEPKWTKQAMWIWKKMWSLFNISTHISNIHIYTFCTMNISLVCNLSGLIIAARLCHKYIIHSAIWSLCTRVSLLYMSHEWCVNQKQNHKSF